jgi:MFS family permease
MPAAGYFLVYGSIMLFQGLWCVTYFLPHYGRDPAIMLMTMIGVGKIISAAMAGTVAKKIGSKRKVMMYANIGYLAIWGVIWMFAADGDMYWLWMCVNFMFGFFSGFMVLAFAQAKEWFPTSISATVISLVNTMIFAGAFVSQYIVSEIVGKNFSMLWGIMFFWVAAACILSYLSIDNRTGSVKEIYRKHMINDGTER